MDRAITDIYVLYVPICVMLFGSIVRIMKAIAQGSIEIGERETERKESVNNQREKINIDKNLQKYFNYKE